MHVRISIKRFCLRKRTFKNKTKHPHSPPKNMLEMTHTSKQNETKKTQNQFDGGIRQSRKGKQAYLLKNPVRSLSPFPLTKNTLSSHNPGEREKTRRRGNKTNYTLVECQDWKKFAPTFSQRRDGCTRHAGLHKQQYQNVLFAPSEWASSVEKVMLEDVCFSR